MESANLIILHLNHKDIWLDYFISRQNLLSYLKSGDDLAVNNDGCNDNKRNCVVKFSNSFKEKIASFERKGYKLKNARVNYIVFWKKEDSDKEVKIVLPELRLLNE
jgi:ATP-dependent DNA helicase RecQ